ncbi:hypothetical protein NDU88_009883 [Pleurodeles waltl]|uniref:Uncharacterized protein n=1 Tax=Pleurodeles waltl TaxID=8319 RepID=A0AAV7PTB6_PLEWA|nr:hypothetical protein NDU88_009883 [Pleurodeles waltl]
MTVKTFFLYKDGAQAPLTDRVPSSGSHGVTFLISGVNARAGTKYKCSYQILGSGEYVISQLSDPVQIEKGPPRPSISYEAVRGVEGDYKINCSAPQDMTVKIFFLYKDEAQAPLTDRVPSSGSHCVTFLISGVNARAGTKYRCSYQILESGEYVTSELSDPLQIKKEPFPKPSLRITSGSVTVRGGNLTLTCTGSRTDVVFALYRGERSFPAQEPPGTEAVFHFTDVNTGHEGRYHCLYYSKGTLRIQSEPSNSVEVTLRDSYPKPLVKLIPGSVVRQGGSLTIHCTTEYHDMRFILFRKGRLHRQEGPPGNEAVFVISGIQQADEGPYQCRYHSQSGPVVWSEASDDFQIRVLGNDVIL